MAPKTKSIASSLSVVTSEIQMGDSAIQEAPISGNKTTQISFRY